MEKRSLIIIAVYFFIIIFLYRTEAAAENYNEHDRIERFASDVMRDGGTLRLRLKSGDYSILTDVKTCQGWDDCEIYFFMDYFKDIGFYLVNVSYYEPVDYLMISDKSGTKYYIHTVPHFSPDRKRFVSVESADAYSKNGVFIWRIEDAKLILEFSHKELDYQFVKWKDNSAISLLERGRIDKKCPSSNSKSVPTILKKGKTAWEFVSDLSKAVCE